MFDTDELEALVLGAPGSAARATACWRGPPSTRWPRSPRPPRATCATPWPTPACGCLGRTWRAQRRSLHAATSARRIRKEHKLRIGYRDGNGQASQRVVWPFALAFFEGKRVLAAWCELRAAFRHFRVDRIADASSSDERYPAHRRDLLARWRRELGIAEDS
ncbi:WYL domain-containing protein [Massilia sp. B-10]|nr:WYL domain-containing protein [Massilia sp. B-10]